MRREKERVEDNVRKRERKRERERQHGDTVYLKRTVLAKIVCTIKNLQKRKMKVKERE